MKDFLNQELAIGDDVIIHHQTYREYIRGVVEKFTPHFVSVTYQYRGSSKTIRQAPKQLIRYNKE